MEKYTCKSVLKELKDQLKFASGERGAVTICHLPVQGGNGHTNRNRAGRVNVSFRSPLLSFVGSAVSVMSRGSGG